MSNFIALDIETANPDLASICQIGLAIFINGSLADTWISYVNPQDYFDPVNVSIHGIDEKVVKNAPTIPQVLKALNKNIGQNIVVHYTHFDRSSINKASDRYNIPRPNIRWLDVSRVARHTWKKYARDGFGLVYVASDLNIQFSHHNALEDARAAGFVLINAIKESGISIDEWITKANDVIHLCGDNTPTQSIAQKGNPEGFLCGEVIVFTGKLSMQRLQAAQLASQAGCDVEEGVNNRTTLLVVGDQDIRKLGGNTKSSKHIKAEKLIKQGHDIKILIESDFVKIIEGNK